MLAALKRLRDRALPPAPPVPAARVPEGERVYAVGDIHGRLDRLEALLDRIDRDDAAREPRRTTLVLLGDLIDRGPASAAVVARVRRLAGAGDHVHVVKGNHEQVMLDAWKGDEAALKLFLRIGGIETLESYGVDLDDLPPGDEISALLTRMHAAIPQEDMAFLAALEDHLAIGDYLFVHAGIRPGVPIGAQDPAELRWIRGPFLDHKGHHGCMVVHGHSISDAPELLHNRLGIDTGAYRTGVLTALGLEEDRRWTLQTDPDATP